MSSSSLSSVSSGSLNQTSFSPDSQSWITSDSLTEEDDEDLIFIKTKIESIFGFNYVGPAAEKSKIICSAFPLFDLIQDDCFRVALSFFNNIPDFKKILKLDLNGLIHWFCYGLYRFKVHQDETRILDFFDKCSKILTFSLKKCPKLASFTQCFADLSAIFSTGRVDLLSQSLDQLCVQQNCPNEIQRYQIALKSYQAVASAFIMALRSMGKRTDDLKKTNPFIQIYFDAKSPVLSLNKEVLILDTRLTKHQKNELLNFFRDCSWKAEDNIKRFEFVYKNLENGDLQDYINNIAIPEISSIICSESGESGLDSQPFDRHYPFRHRALFEGFLPRAREFIDVFLSVAGDLETSCVLLKHFHLYLKFGDLEQLHQALNEKGSKSSNDVIKRHVLAFSQLAGREPLASRIQHYLSDLELALVSSAQKGFGELGQVLNELGGVLNCTLEGAIETAEKYTEGLYLFPPPIPRLESSSGKAPRVLKNRRPIKRSATVSRPSKGSAASSSKTPSISVASNSAASSASSSSAVVPLTPFQKLNQLHNELKMSFSSLKKGCRGYSTVEALGNAQSHLEDLMSVMNRMLHTSPDAMSRTDVMACVVDNVRHMTLAVEQMISALDRESNRIQRESEVKARLTHDLYYGLLNCQFPAGVMNPRLRKWIYHASKGEIYVRNLSKCRLGTPSIQTLLAKVWKYVKGNDALSAREIVREAIQFSQEGVKVCQELHKQIQAAKGEEAFVATRTDVISPLFQTLFDHISIESTVSDEYDPTSLAVASIDHRDLSQRIDHLQEVLNPDGRELENVRLHLLPHLQRELQYVVNPTQARLHAGNVLLSSQMILEEVLETLIDIRQPSYERDPESPHDLKGMITALGIDFSGLSKGEREFLSNGRAVRQLVRYPLSCRSSKIPFLKTISSIMTESMPEGVFDLHFHKGFEMKGGGASKKLGAITKMVQHHSSLLDSLLKKLHPETT